MVTQIATLLKLTVLYQYCIICWNLYALGIVGDMLRVLIICLFPEYNKACEKHLDAQERKINIWCKDSLWFDSS